MVVCLGIALHYWMTFVHSYFEAAHHLPPRNPMVLDSLFFILRDIFNLVVAAGIATTIVLAMRWQHSEEARLEAEAARAEAELRNLLLSDQSSLPAQHAEQYLCPDGLRRPKGTGSHPTTL